MPLHRANCLEIFTFLKMRRSYKKSIASAQESGRGYLVRVRRVWQLSNLILESLHHIS